MCETIDHIMSDINNKTNMVDEKIHKACEMDNDTLNWIDDRLNEMIYVLQRKNMLNNESQVHRNESQEHRNELQILRNKLQVHRSESLTCRNDLQIQTLKSEPQKTFINNKSQFKKMINIIKRVLEYCVCEKCINEKFRALRVSKDMILLYSKYTSIKGFKKIYRIDICRDIISLNIRNYVNNMKEDIALCIDGERVILKVSQTQNHQGIRSKKIYQYLYIMTKSSALHQ